MSSKSRRILLIGLAALGALAFGGLLGNATRTWGAPPPVDRGQTIVLSFGPGGVLTQDGKLWQYRPDTGEWLTIDESFAHEGQSTHVLPLPVDTADIAQMQSFGFIVSKSGTCWLYDLEKNQWREIGTPGLSR